ncbi:MAG: hypothetical protein GY788_03545, partial [bacterium]|nr:hypothetical protein [bacterium]
MRTVTLILCCLLIEPAGATGHTRALLIGIDYRQEDQAIDRLTGAVNDARDWYSLLTT